MAVAIACLDLSDIRREKGIAERSHAENDNETVAIAHFRPQTRRDAPDPSILIAKGRVPIPQAFFIGTPHCSPRKYFIGSPREYFIGTPLGTPRTALEYFIGTPHETPRIGTPRLTPVIGTPRVSPLLEKVDSESGVSEGSPPDVPHFRQPDDQIDFLTWLFQIFFTELCCVVPKRRGKFHHVIFSPPPQSRPEDIPPQSRPEDVAPTMDSPDVKKKLCPRLEEAAELDDTCRSVEI